MERKFYAKVIKDVSEQPHENILHQETKNCPSVNYYTSTKGRFPT